MADPFTMRVVQHLLETPVELLSPQEQTARAALFIALRPLVNLIAAVTTEPNGPLAPTANPVKLPTQPGKQWDDNRGMGE